MATELLRFALAFGVAVALAAAVADSAEAKSKRAVYKKPRHHAPVVRPAVERPYVREPGCVTIYDSSRTPLPDYMNPACENAFRRLYPPR
jgi:hypothetical protein